MSLCLDVDVKSKEKRLTKIPSRYTYNNVYLNREDRCGAIRGMRSEWIIIQIVPYENRMMLTKHVFFLKQNGQVYRSPVKKRVESPSISYLFWVGKTTMSKIKYQNMTRAFHCQG